MQYEQRIADGIDARRPSGSQVVALMRTLALKIEDCRNAGSVEPLMSYVYASAAKAAARLADIPIACVGGCSHCCHSPWIDASPVEVLFMVRSMTAQQRERTTAAAGRIASRTRGMTLEDRSRMVTPCPMLEDDRCTMYDRRPLVCRSLVSSDANACRRAYLELSGESFPAPDVWRTLGAAYAASLEGAVLHAGLVHIPRSIGESLEIALGDSSVERRWFAGEDVFSNAPRAYQSSNFDAASWAYLYRQAFGELPPRGRSDRLSRRG